METKLALWLAVAVAATVTTAEEGEEEEDKNSCPQCDAGGRASGCDPESGRCLCATKGVVGDRCDECDRINHYFGDPVLDNCFYKLEPDYQFKFDLSKESNLHFTGINLMSSPAKVGVDVDFQISCSVPAKFNLTLANTPGREQVILSDRNCSATPESARHPPSPGATFRVYVYELQPPLRVDVSFAQHPKLDLLHLAVVAGVPALVLLASCVAAVAVFLWWRKRRRRQAAQTTDLTL